VFVFVLIFLSSCNTSRRLKPNQYLLYKTDITGGKQTKIPKEQFESFLRQKPNRKFFGTLPFFVAWYNMFNDSVIQLKKEKRNLKYDRINAERIQAINEKNSKRMAKGKPPKQPKLKNKEEPIFRENLRGLGEAPVIHDSSLTQQTAQQLKMFLFNKGFFNNDVVYSVNYDIKNAFGKKRNQKAVVTYSILPKVPYYINRYTYNIEDEKLAPLVYSDTVNSTLKSGMWYDSQKLQDERARITRFLLNKGYYYFENAYVSFNVDSNYAGNYVSVELTLKKFTTNYSGNSDSLIQVNHKKYRIHEVYVMTEHVVGNLRDIHFSDTAKAKNSEVKFLHNEPMQFNPNMLASFIKVHKNTLFIRDTAEATFKSLMSLGVFKGVTIQFYRNPSYDDMLDCYILCTPLVKQYFTAETEGIHTLGSLGIDGSIIYQNRNLNKGGEELQFKLQGALTAQNQIGDEKDLNLTTLSTVQRLFNTFQFGPEIRFSVPRAFFPFSLLPFRNEMAPRTFFKTSLNYQARATFERNILSFENGLSFRSRNRLFRYEITPFEIYSVTAKLSESFRKDLNNLNDAFLLNSFIDHITTLTKFGLVYTSKDNPATTSQPVNYIRWNVMSAGNILRYAYQLADAPKDTAGRYTILNIPFAHFLKTELEYRLHIPLTKKSKLVYRLAGGIGKTLANLNVLPYEQSFFSGGPNSIRAWRARTLGPGGYNPENSNMRFDKIGDLLLEGNIEYRFHIIKSFYGALFADAGNVWRLNKAFDKPNGEFVIDQFYKQIAIGTGVGVRWDLDFLIIRFDFGVPVKDPKYPEGQRFTFDKQPLRSTVINFGIGYPF
jgi:hypothetical protein